MSQYIYISLKGTYIYSSEPMSLRISVSGKYASKILRYACNYGFGDKEHTAAHCWNMDSWAR
jgi:hypothetical protein